MKSQKQQRSKGHWVTPNLSPSLTLLMLRQWNWNRAGNPLWCLLHEVCWVNDSCIYLLVFRKQHSSVSGITLFEVLHKLTILRFNKTNQQINNTLGITIIISCHGHLFTFMYFLYIKKTEFATCIQIVIPHCYHKWCWKISTISSFFSPLSALLFQAVCQAVLESAVLVCVFLLSRFHNRSRLLFGISSHPWHWYTSDDSAPPTYMALVYMI